MVEVEEVSRGAGMRRFVELPFFLFRDEPRWAAPLIAAERVRFDRFGNRRLRELEHTELLARYRGVPAGRIALEVDESGTGAVTAYDVGPEPALAEALVAEARSWFRERGVESIRGPEVLLHGFATPGATGRPWHPDWYFESLRVAGFEISQRRFSWRLPAAGTATLPADPTTEAPQLAGRFGDPRLLLPGIAAVPDLTEARGSARELARRARRGEWSTAVVVLCDGDPSVLVPALQGAAACAGYREILAPWSPDPDVSPETVHVLLRARSSDR